MVDQRQYEVSETKYEGATTWSQVEVMQESGEPMPRQFSVQVGIEHLNQLHLNM